MSRPRAIVFDFGGVLVDWDPRYVYDQLIPNEQERHYFLQHVCNHAWNIQQDGGRSLREATDSCVQQFPEYRDWIEAYYQRWTEMLRGELSNGVALLRRLHAAGIPLLGLTNWSAETFPYAEQQFEFLKLFNTIIVSGRERLIKPDPRIYQLLETRSGFGASDLVFIDDNADNIRAAQAQGWHGIVHHDSRCRETEMRLIELGLRF